MTLSITAIERAAACSSSMSVGPVGPQSRGNEREYPVFFAGQTPQDRFYKAVVDQGIIDVEGRWICNVGSLELPALSSVGMERLNGKLDTLVSLGQKDLSLLPEWKKRDVFLALSRVSESCEKHGVRNPFVYLKKMKRVEIKHDINFRHLLANLIETCSNGVQSVDVVGGDLPAILGREFYRDAVDVWGIPALKEKVTEEMLAEIEGSKAPDIDIRFMLPKATFDDVERAGSAVVDFIVSNLSLPIEVSNDVWFLVRELAFVSFKHVHTSSNRGFKHFLNLSFGGSDGLKTDITFVQQIPSGGLFQLHGLALNILPLYNGEHFSRLRPYGEEAGGWAAVFFRLAKVVTVSNRDVAYYQGWPKLLSFLTRGNTSPNPYLEPFFRKQVESKGPVEIVSELAYAILNHNFGSTEALMSAYLSCLSLFEDTWNDDAIALAWDAFKKVAVRLRFEKIEEGYAKILVESVEKGNLSWDEIGTLLKGAALYHLSLPGCDSSFCRIVNISGRPYSALRFAEGCYSILPLDPKKTVDKLEKLLVEKGSAEAIKILRPWFEKNREEKFSPSPLSMYSETSLPHVPDSFLHLKEPECRQLGVVLKVASIQGKVGELSSLFPHFVNHLDGEGPLQWRLNLLNTLSEYFPLFRFPHLNKAVSSDESRFNLAALRDLSLLQNKELHVAVMPLWRSLGEADCVKEGPDLVDAFVKTNVSLALDIVSDLLSYTPKSAYESFVKVLKSVPNKSVGQIHKCCDLALMLLKEQIHLPDSLKKAFVNLAEDLTRRGEYVRSWALIQKGIDKGAFSVNNLSIGNLWFSLCSAGIDDVNFSLMDVIDLWDEGQQIGVDKGVLEKECLDDFTLSLVERCYHEELFELGDRYLQNLRSADKALLDDPRYNSLIKNMVDRHIQASDLGGLKKVESALYSTLSPQERLRYRSECAQIKAKQKNYRKAAADILVVLSHDGEVDNCFCFRLVKDLFASQNGAHIDRGLKILSYPSIGTKENIIDLLSALEETSQEKYPIVNLALASCTDSDEFTSQVVEKIIELFVFSLKPEGEFNQFKELLREKHALLIKVLKDQGRQSEILQFARIMEWCGVKAEASPEAVASIFSAVHECIAAYRDISLLGEVLKFCLAIDDKARLSEVASIKEMTTTLAIRFSEAKHFDKALFWSQKTVKLLGSVSEGHAVFERLQAVGRTLVDAGEFDKALQLYQHKSAGEAFADDLIYAYHAAFEKGDLEAALDFLTPARKVRAAEKLDDLSQGYCLHLIESFPVDGEPLLLKAFDLLDIRQFHLYRALFENLHGVLSKEAKQAVYSRLYPLLKEERHFSDNEKGDLLMLMLQDHKTLPEYMIRDLISNWKDYIEAPADAHDKDSTHKLLTTLYCTALKCIKDKKDSSLVPEEVLYLRWEIKNISDGLIAFSPILKLEKDIIISSATTTNFALYVLAGTFIHDRPNNASISTDQYFNHILNYPNIEAKHSPAKTEEVAGTISLIIKALAIFEGNDEASLEKLCLTFAEVKSEKILESIASLVLSLLEKLSQKQGKCKSSDMHRKYAPLKRYLLWCIENNQINFVDKCLKCACFSRIFTKLDAAILWSKFFKRIIASAKVYDEPRIYFRTFEAVTEQINKTNGSHKHQMDVLNDFWDMVVTCYLRFPDFRPNLTSIFETIAVSIFKEDFPSISDEFLIHCLWNPTRGFDWITREGKKSNFHTHLKHKKMPLVMKKFEEYAVSLCERVLSVSAAPHDVSINFVEFLTDTLLKLSGGYSKRCASLPTLISRLAFYRVASFDEPLFDYNVRMSRMIYNRAEKMGAFQGAERELLRCRYGLDLETELTPGLSLKSHRKVFDEVFNAIVKHHRPVTVIEGVELLEQVGKLLYKEDYPHLLKQYEILLTQYESFPFYSIHKIHYDYQGKGNSLLPGQASLGELTDVIGSSPYREVILQKVAKVGAVFEYITLSRRIKMSLIEEGSLLFNREGTSEAREASRSLFRIIVTSFTKAAHKYLHEEKYHNEVCELITTISWLFYETERRGTFEGNYQLYFELLSSYQQLFKEWFVKNIDKELKEKVHADYEYILLIEPKTTSDEMKEIKLKVVHDWIGYLVSFGGEWKVSAKKFLVKAMRQGIYKGKNELIAEIYNSLSSTAS